MKSLKQALNLCLFLHTNFGFWVVFSLAEQH